MGSTVRTLKTLALALVLAISLTACGDGDTTVEDVKTAVGDAATKAGDALGTAADKVSEAAGNAGDAAGEAVDNAQFCTAAFQTVDALNGNDIDGAIDHGEDMVAEAPDDIRGDAQRVLDGAKAFQGGDQQAVQSAEFRAAADNVEAYTRDKCDPRS